MRKIVFKNSFSVCAELRGETFYFFKISKNLVEQSEFILFFQVKKIHIFFQCVEVNEKI